MIERTTKLERFVYQTSRDSDSTGLKGIWHYYFFVQQIKIYFNQRLGSAGEDDAFLAIWVIRLGDLQGERALFYDVEIFVLNDTPHAPPLFLFNFDTNNSTILLNL